MREEDLDGEGVRTHVHPTNVPIFQAVNSVDYLRDTDETTAKKKGFHELWSMYNIHSSFSPCPPKSDIFSTIQGRNFIYHVVNETFGSDHYPIKMDQPVPPQHVIEDAECGNLRERDAVEREESVMSDDVSGPPSRWYDEEHWYHDRMTAEDVEEALSDVNTSADCHVYTLKLMSHDTDSVWYYVGQSINVEDRVTKHVKRYTTFSSPERVEVMDVCDVYAVSEDKKYFEESKTWVEMVQEHGVSNVLGGK